MCFTCITFACIDDIREYKIYPCFVSSVCMCVHCGICLLLPMQITPRKHTPNTNTHTLTHTHTHSKEEEVWVLLALRDGQANQTHLETIGDRALKERKGGGGGDITTLKGDWGGQSSCSLLFCCQIATRTNTQRHKQTCATADLTMPASLAANHAAQPVLKGVGGWGGMDEELSCSHQ